MSLFWDGLAGLLLLLGSAFAVIGGLGLIRFPDFYCRLHASGITDTLGAGLLLMGLMIQVGPSLAAVKLAMILVFLFLTSPTSAHALAQSALALGLEPRLDHREEGPSDTPDSI